MSTPIFYIKNGYLSFADKTIFENLEAYLSLGDKICLIGRNGAGKTSLMKTITGDYTLDRGDLYLAPTATIGYLKQDNKPKPSTTIYDYILEGNQKVEKYQAEMILEEFKLDGDLMLDKLSGGQLRQASLIKALVEAPNILLLDEPTNHLDIRLIEWLEEYVKSYRGAVICISHDREFLSNVTNKIWWLDRGELRKSDKGFKYFDTWQEEIIESEMARLEKLEKQLVQENLWLQQGVTARRKRNQKRLSNLHKLRAEVKEKAISSISKKLIIDELESSIKSKFILRAEDISYSLNGRKLLSNFSLSISKGDRIGVVGPNGCGKTTLIRMLAGLEKPTIGSVESNHTLEISYFDQHKVELLPNESLWTTLCPNGGDTVSVMGSLMHVASYLKNFMFDSKQINAKVSTLSGGESARLMLAKILANPGNLLILDEPTNDLDMDSLEVLYEILDDYKGTIIIISHDRNFLDRLVTKTLVFEGEGKIALVIGGYQDYKKIANEKEAKAKEVKAKEAKNNQKKKQGPTNPNQENENQQIINQENTNQVNINQEQYEEKKPTKLSYKYQRRLEVIPSEIEEINAKIAFIETALVDPNLYEEKPDKFLKLSNDLVEHKAKLENLEEEWLKIMQMEEELK